MPGQKMSPSTGRALTPGAIALMLMLCISWGFIQIAVKLVLPDVPPMLQALTRSIGALPVLLIIGWLRGIRFFERDGTLRPGLIAGIIFGIEFVPSNFEMRLPRPSSPHPNRNVGVCAI